VWRCCVLQEQRIRASHNIKKLSTKVADRITKGLKRGPSDSRVGGTVEAAAAAAAAGEGDGSGSGSGGEGEGGGASRLAHSGSRAELADLIRKNGEEIATSVEIVVEKVSFVGIRAGLCMVFRVSGFGTLAVQLCAGSAGTST
jgi:hypothetical protein